MNENFKHNILTHQLTRSVDRAVRFYNISSTELLGSSCSLLAHTATIISQKALTLAQVNNEEQKMIALIRQAVNHIFDSKRQSLIADLPPLKSHLTKHQILESTKQMLLDNTMTLDEGVQLVGEMVSAVTYYQSPIINNLQEIKDLEKETMDHIQGKLNLALEAIQVKQGFVTKQ